MTSIKDFTTTGLSGAALFNTVADTATAALIARSAEVPGALSTVIQVVATKVSGTVGGTISIMGSLDGSNFVALNTEETQTALATKTAADASGTYHWRIKGNPFLFYKVSWTGTGTMNATFTAQLVTR